jgi:hypothetical protein
VNPPPSAEIASAKQSKGLNRRAITGDPGGAYRQILRPGYGVTQWRNFKIWRSLELTPLDIVLPRENRRVAESRQAKSREKSRSGF